MRKTAIFGILILIAVLAMPTVSAHVTLYFDPQDSSVPNGYCNTTYVKVMANITSPDDLMGGQFGIATNGTCINITDVQPGPQIFSSTWSWNAYSQCWDEDHDMIMYGFMTVQTGVVEICNLTIHCNCSTCGYCISPLNFSCGAAGCGACPIEVLKSGNVNLHPANTTLENGTVECGEPPEAKPDLIVDLIDPKYIFAGLNNSMFATVTNQGAAATSGSFDVNVDIRDAANVQLFSNTVSCRQLIAGESTDLHLPELFLGYWTPATPENITITVTADYSNTEAEDNETNNARVETRTYTADCKNDTMLAEYCYGYAGDHPMTEVYSGTGGVIYTIGDHVTRTQIANFTIGSGGDTNQVDGRIADIPDGASVKKATLYVHYGWKSNAVSFDDDPTDDFEMSIDGGSRLTPENYYTDCKNFTTSYTYYQYGAMVYDVTANVTGDGTYQVVRSNASGKGSTYSMSLMVIYNDSSTCTYSIAHGYDRLATLYWKASPEYRWHYYVSPEDATTTATLPDVDPDAIGDSNWFTVAIDTADGTTDGEYQKINDCPRDAGAWLKDAGSYLSFDRTSNCISAAGADEIVYAQESWRQSGNGFGLVFACLQTRDSVSVQTATGTGTATFSVNNGNIEDIVAIDPTGFNWNGTAPECNFLDGLFSFNITGVTAPAVNVTITLPTYVQENITYWKVNTSGKYEVPVTRLDDHTIVITLVDGGLGDNDGVIGANGKIVDPGGPGSSVNVSIDPCDAKIDSDPSARTTVDISLNGIADYGSGTIHLYFDTTYVDIDSIGLGDSTYFFSNKVTDGHYTISASNSGGISSNVAFANVTFKPMGPTTGCSDLNLVVETLYDRNFTSLDTVVNNCTICIEESNIPGVTTPTASPTRILNDNGRARVSGTNLSNLSVWVTDDTEVDTVTIDLTPIRGAGYEAVSMTLVSGNKQAGTWSVETNATRDDGPSDLGINMTHCLVVNATDTHGNPNTANCVILEVLRRGDIDPESVLIPQNNVVDIGDYNMIARYTVGLRSLPDEFTAGTVPADEHNGVDMADALYIAMYDALNPHPGYPAP